MNFKMQSATSAKDRPRQTKSRSASSVVARRRANRVVLSRSVKGRGSVARSVGCAEWLNGPESTVAGAPPSALSASVEEVRVRVCRARFGRAWASPFMLGVAIAAAKAPSCVRSATSLASVWSACVGDDAFCASRCDRSRLRMLAGGLLCLRQERVNESMFPSLVKPSIL